MRYREKHCMKKTTPPMANVLSRGFSLLELMIAVAIVAILATIATTAYTSQVQKSRRTDARSALLDLAGREEKLFSTTNAYSAAPSDLGYGAVGAVWPQTVGSGYYQVSVLAPGDGTYTVTATPLGSQINDTTCTSLSVNQLGAQTATPAANAATCWGN
jgi:type IV pilus assembly protein PilE